MLIRLAALLLLNLPACAQLLLVNAADGTNTNFAPGSLVLFAIQGAADLSTATLILEPSTTVPTLNMLPTGIALARLPANLAIGSASLHATVNGASTPSLPITVVPTSFRIFTGPISAGLLVENFGLQSSEMIYLIPGPHFAQKNNGPLAGLAQPAHPGDYLTIYGTGLGNATPDRVVVTIAGLPVTVTYAGPAPGQPGVDQMNVYVPPGFAAPDSCSDAFTVTIAGTPNSPKALSYTQSATSCPSPIGFNATELAAIDAGTQISYLQLALTSSIAPATPAGFTRSESALALELNSSEAFTPFTLADSVLYSCQIPQAGGGGAAFAILAGGYPALTLSLGATSIPIGQGPITQPPPVATPDALPPALFQPGTYQLSAPNFAQPLQLPPTIQLQNFAALQSIDTTHDLTITWNPSGYSKSDVLSLSMSTQSSSPFFVANSISCNAPAASGSLVIPAAQLQAIPKSVSIYAAVYSSQTPNFRLPQGDGSTLPLQVTYGFSETFPVTLH
jgi:uncharacterized protein (TIGR03437 family)